MSRTFLDCDICGLNFDADNEEHLWCNMCGCAIGSCCMDAHQETLGDGPKRGRRDQLVGGEMLEDKCPFCNKKEVTDAFLLHFALKKLKMSREQLVANYKAEGKDGN